MIDCIIGSWDAILKIRTSTVGPGDIIGDNYRSHYKMSTSFCIPDILKKYDEFVLINDRQFNER